jgi:hypothetical protein
MELISTSNLCIPGRYQSRQLSSKFQPNNRSETCPLCNAEVEDTLHLISKCKSTDHLRSNYLAKLKDLYKEEGIQAPTTQEEICAATLNGGNYIRNGVLVEFKRLTTRANDLINIYCSKLDNFKIASATFTHTPKGGLPTERQDLT